MAYIPTVEELAASYRLCLGHCLHLSLGQGVGHGADHQHSPAGTLQSARLVASCTHMEHPRIGFFAQGYYGYPGLDYFKSMMNREMSLNLLAGIKMSWSIGSLYTRDNRLRELRLSADEISVDRDIFLFNTEMQTRSQLTRIRTLEDLIKEDSRIVELRGNVRKAAEAQLDNGVIDATAVIPNFQFISNRYQLSSYKRT